MWLGSGRWSDGDGVAGGFELADVVIHTAGGVLASGVEVLSEIDVGLAGGGHVPGRDQDGVGYGDGGLVRSAPAGDTPVSGREEGALGSRRCPGGFDEGLSEVPAGATTAASIPIDTFDDVVFTCIEGFSFETSETRPRCRSTHPQPGTRNGCGQENPSLALDTSKELFPTPPDTAETDDVAHPAM